MAGREVSRRRFMQTAAAGAATAATLRAFDSRGRADVRDTGERDSDSVRRLEIPLNEGWRFKRQASPGSATEPEFVGAERLDYNDSSWAQVWLPYTWDATADNPFVTSGHFRGIGWYRKNFEVPEGQHDRRFRVQFKGVFQVADVWVNGRQVGQHVGGYTSFGFDVTECLDRGKPNLLAVKVDDVLNPFIAPAQETNVANYGGIFCGKGSGKTVGRHYANRCDIRDRCD
jgi:beta-galactosidase